MPASHIYRGAHPPVGSWVTALPPIKEGKPDESAPLADWEATTAYDSAKACEEGSADWQRSLAEVDEFISTMKSGDFLVEHPFRCVPAEAIYPPATK